MNDEERFKRRLLGYLASAGARALYLNARQQKKLVEWVLPYLADEFQLSTEPINIEKIRKFVDAWEHTDLSPEAYKYYYVDKETDGKDVRDHLPRIFWG